MTRGSTEAGPAPEEGLGTPPSRVGRYEILHEIGRGGQGTVYLARDTELRRKVALKVLDRISRASPVALERFRREAETASRLDHPGICTVFEAGVVNGLPYIAMRHIEGRTLAAVLAAPGGHGTSTVAVAPERPAGDATTLGEDDASTRTAPGREELDGRIRWIEGAARALHAAHEAGVIHRDVKPGNIMIGGDGQPVVLDFGIARDEGSGNDSLTWSGGIFGTPAYMSPEQVAPKALPLDRRTDVWSLGVTLYEAATGRRPFDHPTREGLYRAILLDPPPDPKRANREISSELRTVLLTALEKDRDRRYQTALGLAEDLGRLLRREPIRARPPGPATRLYRWTQRNPRLALALGGLILSLATGLAISLRLVAERDRALDRTEALRLTAESGRVLGQDPTLALLLGLEAAALHRGPDSDNALLAALDRLRVVSIHEEVVAISDPFAGALFAGLRDGALARIGAGGAPERLGPAVDGLSAIAAGAGSVATIGAKGICELWDPATGARVAELDHGTPVTSAAWYDDGRKLMTVGSRGARLWDGATGGRLLDVETGEPDVLAAAIDGRGRSLVLCPFGRPARLFRLPEEAAEGGTPLGDPPEGMHHARAEFTPSGDRLLLHGPGLARGSLWDPASGERVALLPEGASRGGAAVDPLGESIVTWDRDGGAFRRWSARDGAFRGALAGPGGGRCCVAWDSGGRKVLIGSADGSLAVWDVESGTREQDLRGSWPVDRAAWSPDGSGFLSFAARGPLVRWRREPLGADPRLTPEEAWDLFPAFDPRSGSVVRPDGEGRPAREATPLREVFRDCAAALRSRGAAWRPGIAGHWGAVVSPDGRRAATVLPRGGVRVHDLDGGVLVYDEPGGGKVLDVSLSADGSRLFLYTLAGRGAVVHLDEGGRRVALSAEGVMERPEIVPSPDGALAATVLVAERAVRVADSGSGRVVAVLRGGTEKLIQGVAFAPGRNLVIAAAPDGAPVWELRRPERPVRFLRGHRGAVTWVTADREGGTAATLGADRTARLWDLATGDELLTIPSSDGAFVAARFSADGRRLFTVSDEGRLREWPLDVVAAARAAVRRSLTPDERARFRLR